MKSTAWRWIGSGLRRRQVGAVQAALAVDVLRGEALAHERAVGAGGHRDVGASRQLQDRERVSGRVLDGRVARHGGDACELELGAREREQQGDRIVVARIAIDDDSRRHQPARTPSSSAAVGSDGCAPSREAASAPAAHARASASMRGRPSTIETASVAQNASPAAVPSTASTGGRRRPGHLPPALEEHRALLAEREGEQARLGGQRLPLVAVGHHEVGTLDEPRGQRPRRGGVEAEEAGCLRRQPPATASSGISSWQSTASACRSRRTSAARTSPFAPGATTIWFSPCASTRISATPVGEPVTRTPETSTPTSCERRHRLLGEGVVARRRRSATRRPRACAAAAAWLAPLPPGMRAKVAPVTVSPGPRQPLAARDQVEVHRADDGRRVAARHATLRERSRASGRSRREAAVAGRLRRRARAGRPALWPSRFSRRSKRPAQSEARSGAARMRAESASPSSARTSTASSRYTCATRTAEARTPARSAAPGPSRAAPRRSARRTTSALRPPRSPARAGSGRAASPAR